MQERRKPDGEQSPGNTPNRDSAGDFALGCMTSCLFNILFMVFHIFVMIGVLAYLFPTFMIHNQTAAGALTMVSGNALIIFLLTKLKRDLVIFGYGLALFAGILIYGLCSPLFR